MKNDFIWADISDPQNPQKIEMNEIETRGNYSLREARKTKDTQCADTTPPKILYMKKIKLSEDELKILKKEEAGKLKILKLIEEE